MPLASDGTWFELIDPADNDTIFTFFSEFEPHSIGQTIVETIVYVLIMIFGITGNVMIILAVAKYHHLRIPTNLFIANMAASDLLQLVMAPTVVITRWTEDWVLGSGLCAMIYFVQILSAFLSVWAMMLISIDRFMAVCKPHVRVALTNRVACVIIVAMWVVAGLFVSPYLYLSEVRQIEAYGRNYTFCHVEWGTTNDGAFDSYLYYSSAIILIFALCPLVVVTVNYICIWRVVHGAAKKLETSHGVNLASRNAKLQYRLWKMFVTIVILYVLCYMPMFGVMAAIFFTLVRSTVISSCMILCLFNTIMSPVIYGYFNENFKAAFQSFCCMSNSVEPASPKTEQAA